MNRFQKRKPISTQKIWSFCSLIFLAILFCVFLSSIKQIDQSTETQQMKSLQETIQKDIAQCYALEGTYPPDLTYLEEHYGLFYNKDKYYVDYISIGSNIFPDVSVLPVLADQ